MKEKPKQFLFSAFYLLRNFSLFLSAILDAFHCFCWPSRKLLAVFVSCLVYFSFLLTVLEACRFVRRLGSFSLFLFVVFSKLLAVSIGCSCCSVVACFSDCFSQPFFPLFFVAVLAVLVGFFFFSSSFSFTTYVVVLFLAVIVSTLFCFSLNFQFKHSLICNPVHIAKCMSRLNQIVRL